MATTMINRYRKTETTNTGVMVQTTQVLTTHPATAGLFLFILCLLFLFVLNKNNSYICDNE